MYELDSRRWRCCVGAIAISDSPHSMLVLIVECRMPYISTCESQPVNLQCQRFIFIYLWNRLTHGSIAVLEIDETNKTTGYFQNFSQFIWRSENDVLYSLDCTRHKFNNFHKHFNFMNALLHAHCSAAGNFFVSIWGEVLDPVKYFTTLPINLWHEAKCSSRNRTRFV